MVYEHFSKCFILEDSYLRFSKLFQVVVVVVHGDIFRAMALMLGINKLLVMAKDTCGFCPIVVGEVFFLLISCSIIL